MSHTIIIAALLAADIALILWMAHGISENEE